MDYLTYISDYLTETRYIAEHIGVTDLLSMMSYLLDLRERKGRLFILGNGGSAATASHAVNDFRKIAMLEAYAPSDHAAEVTAWANDTEWAQCYVNWLQTSRCARNDVLLVLSVGGGDDETSVNLVRCMDFAKPRNIPVLSIVSRDGGEAGKRSDVCLLVPVVHNKRITPHAENWQLIIIHLLCSLLYEVKWGTP